MYGSVVAVESYRRAKLLEFVRQVRTLRPYPSRSVSTVRSYLLSQYLSYCAYAVRILWFGGARDFEVCAPRLRKLPRNNSVAYLELIDKE